MNIKKRLACGFFLKHPQFKQFLKKKGKFGTNGEFYKGYPTQITYTHHTGFHWTATLRSSSGGSLFYLMEGWHIQPFYIYI